MSIKFPLDGALLLESLSQLRKITGAKVVMLTIMGGKRPGIMMEGSLNGVTGRVFCKFPTKIQGDTLYQVGCDLELLVGTLSGRSKLSLELSEATETLTLTAQGYKAEIVLMAWEDLKLGNVTTEGHEQYGFQGKLRDTIRKLLTKATVVPYTKLDGAFDSRNLYMQVLNGVLEVVIFDRYHGAWLKETVDGEVEDFDISLSVDSVVDVFGLDDLRTVRVTGTHLHGIGGNTKATNYSYDYWFPLMQTMSGGSIQKTEFLKLFDKEGGTEVEFQAKPLLSALENASQLWTGPTSEVSWSASSAKSTFNIKSSYGAMKSLIPLKDAGNTFSIRPGLDLLGDILRLYGPEGDDMLTMMLTDTTLQFTQTDTVKYIMALITD